MENFTQLYVKPIEKNGFNHNAILPYGLQTADIEQSMDDFCKFLSIINRELNNNRMPLLEQMLMQANFSSIVGEFMNTTIPKYCKSLVKNKYHNGHPDLIEKGKFPKDAIQHSHEGIEVKASRYEKGWQGHNPENIWLMVFVFECTNPSKDVEIIPFSFKAVYGANLEEKDWQFAGRKEGSRRTITATVKNSGFQKMNENWIYKLS
jgi:hypothetical protein